MSGAGDPTAVRAAVPPVALVTGAAQGVGLGIAQVLARAGYRVALADILAEPAAHEAQQLADAGHTTLGLDLDVTQAASWDAAVRALIDTWGRLDLLVNNAGISPRGTAESVDEPLWDRTIALNLKGPWLGVKACLPHLRAVRGTIVNIGSTRATRPRRDLFVYGISKAGLLGLTRQVAVDELSSGVTCNMVAPGWVDTPGERILQARHGRPRFPEGIRNLVTPEEVGEAVVYLASPAGRRVNGTIHYVDSGLHFADNAEMVFLPEADDRPPL